MSSTETDWDQLWKEDPEAFHTWPENELVRWASTLAPGSKVLEVGCGNGANLRALKGFGHDPWGVDISTAAYGAFLASEAFPAVSHANVITPVSATHLPFASFTFDAVADVQCLQHLASDDLPRAYGEIARVLKPGGRFFSMFLTAGQEFFPDLRFTPFSWRPVDAADFDLVWAGKIERSYSGKNWDRYYAYQVTELEKQ